MEKTGSSALTLFNQSTLPEVSEFPVSRYPAAMMISASSLVSTVMKNCSRLGKIFLTAMVHELYKTGMGETTFEKLAMTVSCLCGSNGEVFPGHDIHLQVG